jgi:hypothetical protein
MRLLLRGFVPPVWYRYWLLLEDSSYETALFVDNLGKWARSAAA